MQLKLVLPVACVALMVLAPRASLGAPSWAFSLVESAGGRQPAASAADLAGQSLNMVVRESPLPLNLGDSISLSDLLEFGLNGANSAVSLAPAPMNGFQDLTARASGANNNNMLGLGGLPGVGSLAGDSLPSDQPAQDNTPVRDPLDALPVPGRRFTGLLDFGGNNNNNDNNNNLRGESAIDLARRLGLPQAQPLRQALPSDQPLPNNLPGRLRRGQVYGGTDNNSNNNNLLGLTEALGLQSGQSNNVLGLPGVGSLAGNSLQSTLGGLLSAPNQSVSSASSTGDDLVRRINDLLANPEQMCRQVIDQTRSLLQGLQQQQGSSQAGSILNRLQLSSLLG